MIYNNQTQAELNVIPHFISSACFICQASLKHQRTTELVLENNLFFSPSGVWLGNSIKSLPE